MSNWTIRTRIIAGFASNMAIEQLNDAARGLPSGVSRFTLAG